MTQIIESIQSIQNTDSIHVKSFKYSNMKAVLLERHSQAIFGEQNRKKGTLNLRWEIMQSVVAYWNTIKRCLLLRHFWLLNTHPNYKKPQILSKCGHQNKFLLKNLNRDDSVKHFSSKRYSWNTYIFFTISFTYDTKRGTLSNKIIVMRLFKYRAL